MVNTRTRLPVRRGGPSILAAHASNFAHARAALRSRFEHFVMLASNALLVRPGIAGAMAGRTGTRHRIDNPRRPDAPPRTWAEKWGNDSALAALRAEFGVAHLPVRKQFHEGSFYTQEIFAPLATAALAGRIGAHGPKGMGDDRPQWRYPAEEIYPPTLLQARVNQGVAVDNTFVLMDWSAGLRTSVANVSHCDQRSARLRPCFGVKRVELEPDDPVRVHVRRERLAPYMASARRRRDAAAAAAELRARYATRGGGQGRTPAGINL